MLNEFSSNNKITQGIFFVSILTYFGIYSSLTTKLFAKKSIFKVKHPQVNWWQELSAFKPTFPSPLPDFCFNKSSELQML